MKLSRKNGEFVLYLPQRGLQFQIKLSFIIQLFTTNSNLCYSQYCTPTGEVPVRGESESVTKEIAYLETPFSTFTLFSALNLKEIPYDIKPVSLIKAGGEQHSNEYREINPMEQVPALHIDGNTIIESLNIMTYLEETRPQRPLLPQDVIKRAKVTLLECLQ